MTRKPLSKKIRFAVFKRDKFTCQYCGRMSPDVILEVDHITPVSQGGDDSILNLITSCRDCNRGKGKERLAKNEALKRQQKALKELAEKQEQCMMLSKWKSELAKYTNNQAESISGYLNELTGFTLNEYGIQDAKRLLKQFTYSEILEAIDIAFTRYWDGGDNYTWTKAWKKVGGICYNKRNEDDGEI